MESNESNEELKSFVFKRLTNPTKKDNLEDVIKDGLSISVDSLPYEEMDFILAREISQNIREESPLKMMTINIVQTYKINKNDYDYEEKMKPRRELTFPSEGNIF
jgi:hypothetical protein